MTEPESISVEKNFLRKVMLRMGLGVLFIPLFILLPAGSWKFWQAWVYSFVLICPILYICVFFLKHDPEFLERRMRTREKEVEQKRIIKMSFIPFVIMYILPGLDFRFGWSRMPVWMVLLGTLIVFSGYLVVIVVFRENRYASRIVEVEEKQKVIQSGPYAIVRHPMYVGVLLLYLFTPIALGSYWALLPALLIIPILIARIINEEEVLARDLKGYTEYMQKTPYRLIPGIW